ncbi:tyrosine-type recombinase/integrase [Actinacidiphila bryophytorum]|uniref:Site-specific recombinase XerC n=1 Tax=Actinacidiphila bryophytorum TaxID=1436133 RepID=A0A9W4H008_9ACTN|nr:site-specific integrase [Actinacidiphila bryophytorum]MBM9434443.1 site-specific integrase [Actinacidiphila bryophytorum]MBN6541917.1 site-specific integrase [Actinacidiphila bryophytorum]CAG7626165.1 Site-specific recombinase XerC [Actinacidiphila bryophytorum]
MAGHIQDRWYKTEKGPDGKPVKVKSDRYGLGLRYRARYVGPDGTEKSKSFPDRQKRAAEAWLTNLEADMSRGQYIDPRTSRITFREYAERWLAALTTDLTSRAAFEGRLRLHALPYLGSRPIGSFQPEHVREWLRDLEDSVAAASYRRLIFDAVSSVLNAAVDDRLLPMNPCRARSVKAPRPAPTRVHPWSAEQVFAVREGLPDRYWATADVGGGCGLRQGEIFGLAVDNIGDLGWLYVRQQIKKLRGGLVFAPPKRGKIRDVPLDPEVSAALTEHMKRFPPVDVTLPWLTPTGPKVTHRLIFTSGAGSAVWSNAFNDQAWKPALASAGIIPVPEKGKRYEAAREHGMHALRHFYASVLLDAGENVKALSLYLGHSDPGFTLRVYTHLMPSSETRTRSAISAMYRAAGHAHDGPETAHAA